MKQRLFSAIGVAVFSAILVGCGASGPPTATVSGTVKYRGQPLTTGIVTVQNDQGQSGAAQIQADGSYKITNAPLGANKAAVAVLPAAPSGAKIASAGAPPRSAAPAIKLPPQYSDPARSGLSIDVKGNQTFDIDLK